MSRLNYLPAAVGDLDEIYFYIGQHDEEAARRMLDRIYRAAVRLERFPLSAPARSEIGEGIRSLAVKDYLSTGLRTTGWMSFGWCTARATWRRCWTTDQP